MMLITSILSLPFIRLHLMFITLDGLSNSGKSTQAESLTRRIQNVNNIWSYTEYARCMDEITSTLDNRGFGQKTNEHFRIVRAARPFAALTAAYKTFRSIPPMSNMIIQHFWNTIFYDYEVPLVDEKSIDEHICKDAQLIPDDLYTAGLRVPDCSVYLAVPYDLSRRRKRWRTDHPGILMKEQPMTPQDAMIDVPPTVTRLAKEYDWFHVLNSAQPVDQITTEILALVD